MSLTQMCYRRTCHKPPERFYIDFKNAYSYLAHAPETPVTPARTLNNSLGMSLHQSQYDSQDASNEHSLDTGLDWKLDPAGYLDGDVYETYTGYWPPTPGMGGGGSVYQTGDDPFNNNQSSNLGISTGLETPLTRSLPNSAFHASHSGSLTMNDVLPSEYHPSSLFGSQFHTYHMDRFHAEAFQHGNTPRDLHDHHNSLLQDPVHLSQVSMAQSDEPASRFRFRVTLHTATAMVKNVDEIPLTYLNKCQTYKMSIKDTVSRQHSGNATKYRTYIRISFDDEQQREKPGHCWQLWKEGRGMNEAHQRGGKLQAVEFVPMNQGQSPGRNSNFEVLSESFDGFCIAWKPSEAGAAECEIQLRFNFLSTDFSHSKGVKGIPVRLCAKTEIMGSSSVKSETEVCYCKVKLFRDHGAERKIANDEAHVKKNIDKLSQQINQAQIKLTEGGKRRRSDSMSGNSRPSKMAKHKRASSVSSVSSSGAKETAEDDLHGKLTSLSGMLISRKPESLLFLTGDEQDDPDLFPVTLQGINHEESFAGSPEMHRLERHSTLVTSTSAGSPTLSAGSPMSPHRQPQPLQCPTPANPTPTKSSNDISFVAPTAPRPETSKNPQHLLSPPDVPTKVERTAADEAGTTSRWIEAVGVDESYKAPTQKIKPVACFYIMPTIDGNKSKDAHYRAIYLRQRTLEDFIEAVARKCGVDASSITEVVHINSRNLSIKFDDEVLLEVPEGQDMQVDLSIKTKAEDVEEKATGHKPAMAYAVTLRY